MTEQEVLAAFDVYLAAEAVLEHDGNVLRKSARDEPALPRVATVAVWLDTKAKWDAWKERHKGLEDVYNQSYKTKKAARESLGKMLPEGVWILPHKDSQTAYQAYRQLGQIEIDTKSIQEIANA